MTCMGVVHNYAGLMAVRWFLGLSEAGLFPGVGYFLSCWYKRSEFGVRMAIFFSAAALAGSFGGLLAAAIAKMDGVGGLAGWSWIFILEGLATFVIGVASFWCVYDFPDQARFLSEDDRKRVLRRLALDQQSSAEHEEFKMDYFWASVKDWKTYTGAVIYMGADGALYAFSLFVPTIISELVSCMDRLVAGTVLIFLRVMISLSFSSYEGLRLYINFTSRLQFYPRSAAECSALCSGRSLDSDDRLHRRSHPPARPLQYRRFVPGHDWILHAPGLRISRGTLRGSVLWRDGHLPGHREHDLLDE